MPLPVPASRSSVGLPQLDASSPPSPRGRPWAVRAVEADAINPPAHVGNVISRIVPAASRSPRLAPGGLQLGLPPRHAKLPNSAPSPPGFGLFSPRNAGGGGGFNHSTLHTSPRGVAQLAARSAGLAAAAAPFATAPPVGYDTPPEAQVAANRALLHGRTGASRGADNSLALAGGARGRVVYIRGRSASIQVPPRGKKTRLSLDSSVFFF